MRVPKYTTVSFPASVVSLSYFRPNRSAKDSARWDGSMVEILHAQLGTRRLVCSAKSPHAGEKLQHSETRLTQTVTSSPRLQHVIPRVNMLRTAQLLRSLPLILNYYTRPDQPVPAIGPLFPGCLRRRSAVPAQAACLLRGTLNFASQAHCQRALFIGVVVSILPLEGGLDNRQTRDPHRLASPGI